MLIVRETYQKIDTYAECYEIEFIRENRIVASMSASDNLSECPEDATLGRDLNFIFGVKDLFRIAYEAGRNEEEVIYEKRYWNDNEEEVTKEQYDRLYENV